MLFTRHLSQCQDIHPIFSKPFTVYLSVCVCWIVSVRLSARAHRQDAVCQTLKLVSGHSPYLISAFHCLFVCVCRPLSICPYRMHYTASVRTFTLSYLSLSLSVVCVCWPVCPYKRHYAASVRTFTSSSLSLSLSVVCVCWPVCLSVCTEGTIQPVSGHSPHLPSAFHCLLSVVLCLSVCTEGTIQPVSGHSPHLPSAFHCLLSVVLCLSVRTEGTIHPVSGHSPHLLSAFHCLCLLDSVRLSVQKALCSQFQDTHLIFSQPFTVYCLLSVGLCPSVCPYRRHYTSSVRTFTSSSLSLSLSVSVGLCPSVRTEGTMQPVSGHSPYLPSAFHCLLCVCWPVCPYRRHYTVSVRTFTLSSLSLSLSIVCLLDSVHLSVRTEGNVQPVSGHSPYLLQTFHCLSVCPSVTVGLSVRTEGTMQLTRRLSLCQDTHLQTFQCLSICLSVCWPVFVRQYRQAGNMQLIRNFTLTGRCCLRLAVPLA